MYVPNCSIILCTVLNRLYCSLIISYLETLSLKNNSINLITTLQHDVVTDFRTVTLQKYRNKVISQYSTAIFFGKVASSRTALAIIFYSDFYNDVVTAYAC